MSDSDFVPDQLQIITYPHPTLRYVAKSIKRVDPLLKQIGERMIELMYEHKGVGLAATQVGLPLRMFVWNPAGKPDEGTASVFINPMLSRPRSNEEAEEGCLSLPGINANVIRAKTVRLHAYDIHGREIDTDFSGWEARILQHETDHLDGVLFIDRLSPERVRELEKSLQVLETDYRSRQRLGSLPGPGSIEQDVARWENRYAT